MLYIGQPKKSMVKVENYSDVGRRYWVEKVRDDWGCVGECVIEGERIIQPKST